MKVKKMSISEASNVIALDRPALPSVETSREKHLPVLAEQVRSHSQSSTASIIAIGKALLEAKEHLKHGQFCEWVSRECGFTIRSAQNYMRVAEFVAREGEMFSLLNPAIIYLLAAPKTPRAVFACVVEMFRRGLVPTEAEVLVLTLAYSWKG